MTHATVPEWSWCCNSSEAASYNAKAQSRGVGIKRSSQEERISFLRVIQ
ncbi:MAG: hypothetical protein ACM3ME_08175 [Chloroflexota bacterium]